jgi:hypothetical protein
MGKCGGKSGIMLGADWPFWERGVSLEKAERVRVDEQDTDRMCWGKNRETNDRINLG